MRRPQQAAEPRGRYAAVFLEWQTSRHPSSFLFNPFQVFTRLPSFCSINKASKTHRPLVAASVCCLRCQASVSSAPQTSQVTFRHRTTPVMCSDRWQMSLLKFLAPFISSFSQLTGLNQLRQRLAEEIRSVTPSFISLECVVLFIFCCYLYGPSVTLLLRLAIINAGYYNISFRFFFFFSFTASHEVQIAMHIHMMRKCHVLY